MAIGGVAVDVNLEALAAICRDHGVRELALFGSVLRDDFTPTSDIDVLVEFQPNSPVRSLFQLVQFKHTLEDHLFHRDVDLVEKRTLSRYICDEVLSSRRIVYAAPR